MAKKISSKPTSKSKSAAKAIDVRKERSDRVNGSVLTQTHRSSTNGRYASHKSSDELAAKKTLTIKAFRSAYRDNRKAS